MACQNRHLRVVQALLGRGALVNQARHDGVKALMMTCQKGHLPVVQALLGGGASVNQATHDGGTALIMACREGPFTFPRLSWAVVLR